MIHGMKGHSLAKAVMWPLYLCGLYIVWLIMYFFIGIAEWIIYLSLGISGLPMSILAHLCVVGPFAYVVYRMISSLGILRFLQSWSTGNRGSILSSRGGRRRDFFPASLENARLILHGRVPCAIQAAMENRGVLVTGAPGTGKTVFFSHLLYGLLSGTEPRPKSQKIVIHDYKGDYTASLAHRSDTVLVSPFDKRGKKWCPWIDIFDMAKQSRDVGYANAAAALCPEPEHGERMWAQGAQEIFVAVLHYLEWLREQDPAVGLNGAFKELISLDGASLRDVVIAAPEARRHVSQLSGIEHNDKTASSFFQTFSVAARQVERVLAEDGDFSLLDALRNEQTQIVILQNYPKYRDAMRTIQALAVQLILIEILSRPDVGYNPVTGQPEEEIVLLLDEFHQVGKVPALQPFVTNYRSKGAAPFLAVQGWGSLKDIYGNNLTQEISNCFNLFFSYRVNSHEDADAISKALGEREVHEETSSRSGANPMGSFNEQIRKDRLVLDGEILSLPDLTYFAKIPGRPVSKYELEYYGIDQTGPSFLIDDEPNPAQAA